MICPICGREHLHDPGTFIIITVFRSEIFPKMLIAYAESDSNPDYILGTVHGFNCPQIEERADKAWPGTDRHWHWHDGVNQ